MDGMYLVERRVALSKKLFCAIDIIGHNMGDSCSRAISLGSGYQVAEFLPLMAS